MKGGEATGLDGKGEGGRVLQVGGGTENGRVPEYLVTLYNSEDKAVHVNSMRNSLLSVVESLHGRIIKKKKTKQTWEYNRNREGIL